MLPLLVPGAASSAPWLSGAGAPADPSSERAPEEGAFADLLAVATAAAAPEPSGGFPALPGDAAFEMHDTAALIDEASDETVLSLVPIVVSVPLDLAAAMHTARAVSASADGPSGAEDQHAAAFSEVPQPSAAGIGGAGASSFSRGGGAATGAAESLDGRPPSMPSIEVAGEGPPADAGAPSPSWRPAIARPVAGSQATPEPAMPQQVLAQASGEQQATVHNAVHQSGAPAPPAQPQAVTQPPATAASPTSQSGDAALETAIVAADGAASGTRRDASARDEEMKQAGLSAQRELAAALGRTSAADQSPSSGGETSHRDGRQPFQAAPSDMPSLAHAPAMPAGTAGFGVPMAETLTRPAVQGPVPELPMTPGQTAENVARLVESFRVQWRQGVPEATVKLNPAHLGEVTISIRVDRGHVAAVVHAEAAGVQQWLEAQEEKMRSGLADQGLTLERFVVQRDRQQQQRRDGRQSPPARYRGSEPSGQRFEITV